MITFDTGALIAVERRDRVMLAFMTTALAAGSRSPFPRRSSANGGGDSAVVRLASWTQFTSRC